MNLVLTYIDGKDFIDRADFRVFLASARKEQKFNDCGETTTTVVLHHTEYESEKLLSIEKEYGVKFLHSPLAKGRNVLRDRWLVYHDELRKLYRYNLVALADARDIVFQGNPFQHRLRPRWGTQEFVAVCSEGMKHRDSQWNLIDQFKYQMQFDECQLEFKDWDVYNAGFLVGTASAVADLCLLMWQGYLGRNDCSDQAVFNYLINGPYGASNHVIRHDPNTSHLCLTGEGMAKGHVKANPVNGYAHMPVSHTLYCVFHQWDRTECKQAILDRHKN